MLNPPTPPSLRLPFTYDSELLVRDLETAYRFVWKPESPFILQYFNGSKTPVFHDGKWKGLGLVTQGGSSKRTDPGGPGLSAFKESEVLAHTPYFRKVVEDLKCPKRSVRLSLLPPGANIQEHCDTYHDFRFGQVRLHVPLITHDEVLMTIGGERVRWAPGELWYGDFSKPHKVVNNSPVTRVHIIMDVMINPFILSLFPPDIVERWRERGIVMHRKAIRLPKRRLKEFECKFYVPQAVLGGLFEMDDGSPARHEASIRLVGKKLRFYLEERPMFALDPVTPRRFYLTGWVGERFFEFRKENGTVTGLKLVMRDGNHRSHIQFPLLPV